MNIVKASGGTSTASGGLPGIPFPKDEAQQQQQEEKKRDIEEMRRTMLATILNNEARERLARIKIVKEEKAKAVEEMIIRMAQSGQIRGKVTESQLIDLLEQISQEQSQATKITISRRRASDSDDEEDWNL